MRREIMGLESAEKLRDAANPHGIPNQHRKNWLAVFTQYRETLGTAYKTSSGMEDA